MIITSLQNEKVKNICKLHDKKHRREQGKTIIEGEKFVAQAAANGLCEEIFVSESFKNPPADAVVLSDAVFKKVSQETSPQGILAVVKTENFKCGINPLGNFLVLDRIQNPSNLGAIIRSAAAFNFCEIFLIDCADVFSPKTIQASAGNIFKVKFRQISLNEIPQNERIVLTAADFNGKNINTFMPVKNKIYGLVLGNEGSGVSSEIKKMCGEVLTINMANNVESLNVATAATVIMFKLKGEK